MSIGEPILNFESMGSGSPLVLLHGTALSAEVFKPTLEDAAEYSKVFFLDQRGCGHNKQLPSGTKLTLSDFTEDLETLRSYLKLEKMTLLGHSWGAYLALAYALKHESALRKLILVSPPPPYAETDEQIHRWMRSVLPEMRREIEKITKSNMSPNAKASKRLEITLPAYFQNLVAMEEFRRRQIIVRHEVVEQLTDPRFYKDLRPELGKLRIPVIIMVGTDDRRTPVEYSEEIRDLLYDSKMMIFPDCGHFPFLERPNLFKAVLRQVCTQE